MDVCVPWPGGEGNGIACWVMSDARTTRALRVFCRLRDAIPMMIYRAGDSVMVEYKGTGYPALVMKVALGRAFHSTYYVHYVGFPPRFVSHFPRLCWRALWFCGCGCCWLWWFFFPLRCLFLPPGAR